MKGTFSRWVLDQSSHYAVQHSDKELQEKLYLS